MSSLLKVSTSLVFIALLSACSSATYNSDFWGGIKRSADIVTGKTPCAHGHPEDQLKCRNREKPKSNNKESELTKTLKKHVNKQ